MDWSRTRRHATGSAAPSPSPTTCRTVSRNIRCAATHSSRRASNPTAGYSFMSVLTHTTGRAGVGPRTNVCGFNSETWNGAATVWDQPIDWPTVPMTAGPRNFVWNISWGPHFSDSSDFRYWITKPSFVWQTGRALTFADFEDAPFCDLAYNDATPNANPNLIPDKARRALHDALHGAVAQRPPRDLRRVGPHAADASSASMAASTRSSRARRSPTVTAAIALNSERHHVHRARARSRSTAAASVGQQPGYTWSVDSAESVAVHHHQPDERAGDAESRRAAGRAGRHGDPARDQRHRVGHRDAQFLHQPVVNTQWFDLGALTDGAAHAGRGRPRQRAHGVEHRARMRSGRRRRSRSPPRTPAPRSGR